MSDGRAAETQEAWAMRQMEAAGARDAAALARLVAADILLPDGKANPAFWWFRPPGYLLGSSKPVVSSAA